MTTHTRPDALGRRPWTMKEVHWLCANYAALGPGRCAEVLDRTPGAVVLQAMAHGCGARKVKREEIEPKIRELHGQGLSDQQISGVLGWHRSGRCRVKYWRHLFELPINPQDCKRDGARGAKAACQNNDAKTFVDIRHEKARLEADRRGWSGAKSMAQVRVCEVLRDFGALTVRKIIERQGKQFTPGSYNNARLHLAHLMHVGLVVARKGSQVVYRLKVQTSNCEGDDEW